MKKMEEPPNNFASRKKEIDWGEPKLTHDGKKGTWCASTEDLFENRQLKDLAGGTADPTSDQIGQNIINKKL